MTDTATDPFTRLHPIVQHHIVNSLGWRTLRPLQRETIDPIFAGDHVLALAPTAGGKTEAAFFPLLSRILAEQHAGLSVLYVCPLRALLNNLITRIEGYANACGLRVGVWHGDISDSVRRKIREDPPEILLTTPESIEAMLLSTRTEHDRIFRHLRTVVIDEVHAFGGDDRGWHMLGVLERLGAICGRDLQRIGLSATVGDPDRLLSWMVGSSNGPRQVIAPDDGGIAADIDVTLDYVGTLDNAAKVISRLHTGEKRLVFVDSRAGCETLATRLRQLDVTTFLSHSSLSVHERRDAEAAFAEARDCVIVATSTLELGIDVGDLDRVIQVNSQRSVASFLQRLGRTGRRPGTTRNMLFLATGDADDLSAVLQAAGLLHLWSQGYVEPVVAPPMPLHLLAHQLLAFVIQEGRVGRNLWQEVVGRLPAYADAIDAGFADAIVDHMVATGILFDDDGMLSIGPEGERSYGFRHFMNLTAVFTQPPMFLVRHGAREIGFLDATSLLTPDRHYATVLLAGRSWHITNIDWDRHFAWVEPAEELGEARWSSQAGGWSAVICDAMRDVAAGADPTGVTLTERAQTALSQIRSELSFATPGRTSLVRDGNRQRAQWWSWAGNRANASLSDAIDDMVTGRGDRDLAISVDPSLVSIDAIRRSVLELDPDTLPTPSVAAKFADGMKFADCLPEHLAVAVATARLVDPDGVRRVQRELTGGGIDEAVEATSD